MCFDKQNTNEIDGKTAFEPEMPRTRRPWDAAADYAITTLSGSMY